MKTRALKKSWSQVCFVVNINDYSDDYVMMVEGILNNKPRKSLGYKTPNEVMRKNNRFTNPNLEKIALQG